MSDKIIKMVGDVVHDIETGYPFLDEVGDVGKIVRFGKTIARYVTVAVYPDPVTNEVRKKDVQIVESFDPSVAENPDAECHIHKRRFPCEDCKELERLNYARMW